MNEDSRILWFSMYSLVEIPCVLKEKISLICWQLPHDVHAMEILLFEPVVNFL